MILVRWARDYKVEAYLFGRPGIIRVLKNFSEEADAERVPAQNGGETGSQIDHLAEVRHGGRRSKSCFSRPEFIWSLEACEKQETRS